MAQFEIKKIKRDGTELTFDYRKKKDSHLSAHTSKFCEMARREFYDVTYGEDKDLNEFAIIVCDYIIPGISEFQSTRPRGARRSHHNSLRDKDFFYEIREPMSPIDPKGTGQVATTQKANEINTLLKCEPSRESRTA